MSSADDFAAFSSPESARNAEDAHWKQAAERRIASLTMPRWALGGICDRMVDLVRMQRSVEPQVRPAAIIVCAADHGVANEGVSAFPQEVTGQMIANFLRGGAAISVLARLHHLPLFIADVGSVAPPSDISSGRFLSLSLAKGTQNFVHGPAMSVELAQRAIEVGRNLPAQLGFSEPVRTWIPGEMGIGNTTSSATLTALALGLAPEVAVGRGTGISDETLARKRQVVERAVELHRDKADDPIELLAAVGGLEIAALTGLMLQAAKNRSVVLLDGYTVSVAALIACRIEPRVKRQLIAGHRSAEPGHRAILDELELEPMLDLKMRLGEGSGAALAWPLLESAAELFRTMATFDQARVSDRG